MSSLAFTQMDVSAFDKDRERRLAVTRNMLYSLLERSQSCVNGLMQTDLDDLQETFVKSLLELNESMMSLIGD